MRILIVSAIFPPDIGGPATHTADLCAELRARGHAVTVLALTDETTPTSIDGVVRFPRSWPWPWRTARAFLWIVRHSRDFDAVYATGLTTEAVAGTLVGRRPVVVKVVCDPAWERGARLGLTTETFDAFQHSERGSVALRGMRALRNWSVRRATIVTTPSEHLRHAAEGWGAQNVEVVPNGVRQVATSSSCEATPHRTLDLLYVGRLVALKRVDVLIEGVARARSARLDIVGDGPEVEHLRGRVDALGAGERVRLLGPLEHDAVMQRLASADALVLASSHEGLPHVVLEALVSGTPVVAPAVGGVAEVLRDGIDSMIVDEATPQSFVRAFERLAADGALLARLRAGAAATGQNWRFERCVDRIEASLLRSTLAPPRAVFVGKTRTAIPLPPDQRQKYAIHRRTSPHDRGLHRTPERGGALRPRRSLRSPTCPVRLGTGHLLRRSANHRTRVDGQSPYERSHLPKSLRGLRRSRSPSIAAGERAASRPGRAARRLAHSGPPLRQPETSAGRLRSGLSPRFACRRSSPHARIDCAKLQRRQCGRSSPAPPDPRLDVRVSALRRRRKRPKHFRVQACAERQPGYGCRERVKVGFSRYCLRTEELALRRHCRGHGSTYDYESAESDDACR